MPVRTTAARLEKAPATATSGGRQHWHRREAKTKSARQQPHWSWLRARAATRRRAPPLPAARRCPSRPCPPRRQCAPVMMAAAPAVRSAPCLEPARQRHGAQPRNDRGEGHPHAQAVHVRLGEGRRRTRRSRRLARQWRWWCSTAPLPLVVGRSLVEHSYCSPAPTLPSHARKSLGSPPETHRPSRSPSRGGSRPHVVHADPRDLLVPRSHRRSLTKACCSAGARSRATFCMPR